MFQPNIVLIVADCVRAQNMSIYGYDRDTTPMLKKIISNFVLYQNSISPSMWTLPSHASMFTSTYLSTHELIKEGDKLKQSLITMAEILKRAGYVTIGFCRNPFVSNFTGLDRGFNIFYGYNNYKSYKTLLYELINERARRLRKISNNENIYKKINHNLNKQTYFLDNFKKTNIFKKIFWKVTEFSDKSAKKTNNMVYKTINKIKKRPFFMFIHYNEAHIPYVIPKKYKEKFLDKNQKKIAWQVNQDHIKFYLQKIRMNKSDFLVLKSLYDGAINYLDKRIYDMFMYLKNKNLLDNTLFIVTSDHGENLGEHNLLFHLFSLYDTLIKVPLLIKYPDNKKFSNIDDRIVQNVDILPTILDLIGINDDYILNQMEGNSLISSNIKNRDFEYGVSELMKPFGPSLLPYKNILKKYDERLICIRTKNEKYIHSSNKNHQLYDLKLDPNEQTNIYDKNMINMIELKNKLELWVNKFNNASEKYKNHLNDQFKEEN
ncbi:MAG: sulfatase, partial [Candidatus Hodarchaeota archaeon]